MSELDTDSLIECKQHIASILSAKVKETISDPNITLDDTWETFVKIAAQNPNNHVWTISGKDYPIFTDHFSISTLFDDLYCEKYETISFVDLIDRIEDSENEKLMVHIPALKKEMMASGYTGFTLDW